MSVCDFLPVSELQPKGHLVGSRVAKVGKVAWVRSGFARVRWADGTESDDWLADLMIERDDT